METASVGTFKERWDYAKAKSRHIRVVPKLADVIVALVVYVALRLINDRNGIVGHLASVAATIIAGVIIVPGFSRVKHLMTARGDILAERLAVANDELLQLRPTPPKPPETALEALQRLEKTRDNNKKREDFLNSQEGVSSAESEANMIIAEIEKAINEVKQKHQLTIGQIRNWFAASGTVSLDVRWKPHRSGGTANGSILIVEICRGAIVVPNGPGISQGRPNDGIVRYDYKILRRGENNWSWVSDMRGKKYKSADLADTILKDYFNRLLN